MSRDDFLTFAVWAFVFNNAGVAADRVAVNWVVNGEVTHVGIVHGTDQSLKGLHILGRVAVHLHISDVPRIFKLVVWCLNADFVQSLNVVVYRHMGAVGHIISVSNPGNFAKFLAVCPLELTGSGLGRSTEAGPVHAFSFGVFISLLTNMAHDFQTQLLSLLRFAVMLANKSYQTFSQTAEANGIGSMLQYFLNGVGILQLVTVHPDTLSHKERIVIDVLMLDGLQSEQKIVVANLNLFIQEAPELVHIAVSLQGQHRQINGGKGEVTPAAHLARTVYITNCTGTATHGGNYAVVVARLIVLKIIWSIHIYEVREQSLGRGFAGLLEKIIVRIPRIVVYPRLKLEYGNRENSGFPIT